LPFSVPKMPNPNKKKIQKQLFLESLNNFITDFAGAVSTRNGEWIVKGFIDAAKNIYTVSIDTKVLSKIMELLLLPKFAAFAEKNNYKLLLSEHQNHYPDLTFIDREGHKYAVDIKSTYRKSAKTVNGMTLGAFTGYFRNRKSNKNTLFPYGDYIGHFVFGLIYSRVEALDEQAVYHIDELQNITSVIRDFRFFVQEKYRIAIDRPGSGNTKNIGSVNIIDKLIQGQGPFAALGEDVFDDYWMYYLTKDMAKAAELTRPLYTNLSDYIKFKGME